MSSKAIIIPWEIKEKVAHISTPGVLKVPKMTLSGRVGGIGFGGVKVEVTETVQWSEDPKGEETV